MLKPVFWTLTLFLISSCEHENVSPRSENAVKKEQRTEPEPEQTVLTDDDVLRIVAWPRVIKGPGNINNPFAVDILRRLQISEAVIMSDLEKSPIIGPMTFTAIADAAGIHGIRRDKNLGRKNA